VNDLENMPIFDAVMSECDKYLDKYTVYSGKRT